MIQLVIIPGRGQGDFNTQEAFGTPWATIQQIADHMGVDLRGRIVHYEGQEIKPEKFGTHIADGELIFLGTIKCCMGGHA